MSATYDIVLRNGRVMDPETGRDEIADVAIRGETIAAIGPDLGPGTTELDATGRIVCPGFIDLHGHGQSIPADRMQAFDGVTTSLELEVGALPVGPWYDRQAENGRVLNYGASAAWLIARMAVMIGLPIEGYIEPLQAMGMGAHDRRWSDDAADNAQAHRIADLMAQAMAEGAIGIGIPNGYAMGTGIKELTWVCDAARAAGCPTFTHVAYAANRDPHSAVEAYVRIIGLAGATGCDMHICHLNSTSLQDIEHAVAVLEKAQAQGLPVTIEAYPYGTGATVASASFLRAPEWQEVTGSTYSDIELVRNRHRFASREEFLEAGDADPNDLIMWHFLDVEEKPEHQRLLDLSVTYPGGAIGSDAMPWIRPDGTTYTGSDWPLPADLSAHPRSSGCFTKFLRDYVRERGLVPLMEGLAKCTTIPASIIEGCTPQIRRKARLQVGMDADILVFDYDRLTDRADFANLCRPAEGVEHLLVMGTPVIRDARLVEEARPGQAIRR